jgi:hypothetical protein
MGLKMLAAQCTPSARENSLLEYLNSKPQHMQNFNTYVYRLVRVLTQPRVHTVDDCHTGKQEC